MAISIPSSPLLLLPWKSLRHCPFPSKPTPTIPSPTALRDKLHYTYSASASAAAAAAEEKELVFFDGGSHYGDLVVNLLLGFTLLWLPLTIAAVSRAFFLRYRFTDRRATVVSGFTGGDRTDFPYSAVADVQVVPRLIGEWGDVVISLKDGTKVDLRSVPKFREVADYCLLMAKDAEEKGSGRPRRRGF